MGKKRDAASNAVWDRELQLIYCDICIAEIECGNRPTTFLNKEGWENLEKKFAQVSSRVYTKLQLKNKWDQLKKDWKLWKELKMGETGLGWDPKRKTIDASDEWWKQKLEALPNAKKFRFAGIDNELEEKLDLMFEGITATGSLLHVPGMEGVEEIHGKGKGVLREESIDLSDDLDDVVFNTNAECSNRKRHSTEILKGVSHKKGSSTAILRSDVSKLINVVSGIKSSRESRSLFSPSEAMKVLNSLEEVRADRPFWMHSVRLMRDAVIRELFMSAPPEERVFFLKDYYMHP